MKINQIIAIGLISLSTLLSGCATEKILQEAQTSYSQGNFEDSLKTLQQALEKDPGNIQLRTAYLSLRERSVARMLAAAEEAKTQGRLDAAKQIYLRIITIDKDNSRAYTGTQELDRDQRHQEALAKIKEEFKKGSADNLAERLRQILAENTANAEARDLLRDVELRAAAKPVAPSNIAKALQKTLSIDFKDAMLKQVFEIFSRTTAINFVFDKDVRTDQKVTVFLNGTTIKEALEVILFTNQLEQRALDINTILIYPNTPAKLKDYQSLTVRGFFLSNAEPDQVATVLKTLLKMKDVIVDKRQNLITVRDTPENVRLAEKIISLHDLPESEVMLEVEVLEVNRNRLTALGIDYPNQLTLTPLASTTSGTVTLNDLKNLSASSTGATLTPLTINAKRQTGDINLLANPRIRVRNRETAKILIGDKVPNITTTSTSTGFVSSNVQYLDVGLKLEVVPTITPDNEIAIKIALEVSNIASQVKTSEGTVAYQIGTRTASTVLRLRDGENQVLAGLINDTDRDSANKIPGLGDLPILGRLFSSHTQESNKSEIVLSITPRLVRSNLRPTHPSMEFDSGTENNSRAPASAGSVKNTPGNAISLLPRTPLAGLTTANTNTNNAPENTAATLRWEGPSQVKPNETFTVRLSLTAGQAVTSIPLAIGFDASKFEILDVQEGTLLSQGGAATSFSQRVDKASGQIFVTGTRNNRAGSDNSGATGEGSLLTLTTRAIGTPGVSAFRLITLAAIGLNGTTVATTPVSPLTVTITP